MQPVIGVDVAKGCSVIQGFLSRGEPWGKAETISHDTSGFRRLSALLDELQGQTGIAPVVVLEATGHYHRGMVQYLERNGVQHFILNPLQSKRAKGTKLRKVKTDAADAWHLAEMVYRGDVKPHRTREETYTELQHITRQHEFVTGLFVQAKLNARALLEQVFPAYVGLFVDLFSVTSLRVLQRCLEGNMGGIGNLITEAAGKSHAKRWIQEKTQHLHKLLSAWGEQPKSDSQTKALAGMVPLLLGFAEQLHELEKQMLHLAEALPEVALVKSIPGIGDKLAAAIVAEIGDAGQFQDAKQLVAYAGLDPGIFSSGKFTATSSRITKRGSKRLRRSLYLAVQCGMRRSANHKLKQFYDRKRKEGKPYKVAVIACANKLLHHVYAILRKGEPYKA